MNREIRKIVNWARSQGWTVEDHANGHTRFYNPAGKYVTDYPATPSRPQRRMADLQVKLRKEGLQCRPPSRKERRAKRADATDERDNDQQDSAEKDDE